MAVEAIEHEGWVEVRGSGRLRVEEWIPAEHLPFPAGTRLFIDYSVVTSIDVPLEMFVQAARVMAERGLKVAVFATLDVIFGVSRQTILTAALPEGDQFAVFRSREEALEWLLQPPDGAFLD